MSIMGRFESAVQGIVEGSFGRIFRTRLQAVELSRRLERAMDANLSVAADRKMACNSYEVYLSPRDFDHFKAYARSLSRQLSDGLIAVARDRGYTLTSRPLVRLFEDDNVITGQLRIVARMVDAQAAAAEAVEDMGMTDEETRTINRSDRQDADEQEPSGRAQPPVSIPPAWLTLYRPTKGQPMQLERPIIHIGRHVTNEIIVNDPKVSRYHAEIRYERGQFVVYDLGSTNGIKINGVPTRQPVALRNNDLLTVGSHEFIFQRR